MYTTTNILRNHLDQILAERIIQLFLNDLNINDDGKLQVNEMTRVLIENLFEVRFTLELDGTKKTCDIIFACVIQEVHVKDPTGGGCPNFFYQGITEINFESRHKIIVETMQTRFEAFLKKENGLPKRLWKSIQLNGKEQ
jgi:hypothetical protein